MPNRISHPSPDELSAFSLGQLAPSAASAVESHISECQPCCETLLGLSKEDTFVELLQEAGQLPHDRTVDQTLGSKSSMSSAAAVPAVLAEHKRYEVIRLIGKGGMGDVYEARHRKMDRKVAIKVINRDLVRKPEAVDRFHREVRTAAQLSHPNIVTAYDADQTADFHFMVMEHVDGVDLSEKVKGQGALPIDEACDYVRQAAIGLQHAHELGMVHRDIKPHNLMVTADGTVKILDFGLASLAPIAQGDDLTTESRSDLTAAGAIMGTPDFISPEQANDARKVDIRSDIYSLGTTLYYLLSGQPPFNDGSVMHKLTSHATAEPEPLDSLRSDIPEELRGIISKMIAKKPDDRFQMPADVAAALAPFSQPSARKETQSAADTRPELKANPSRRRSRLILLVSIATLLIAAAVGAIAINFPPSAPESPYWIGGGAGSGGEGWYFSAGHLYLDKDEPGVLFGLVETPWGSRELLYAVLFRHENSDFWKVSNDYHSGLQFDGRLASIKDHLAIDGKGIDLELEVSVDRTEIKSKKVVIDGVVVDADKGNLLLLDLTTDEPRWKQIDADPLTDLLDPKDVLENTELVTMLTERITKHFSDSNGEVREFLAGGLLKVDEETRVDDRDAAADEGNDRG